MDPSWQHRKVICKPSGCGLDACISGIYSPQQTLLGQMSRVRLAVILKSSTELNQLKTTHDYQTNTYCDDKDDSSIDYKHDELSIRAQFTIS